MNSERLIISLNDSRRKYGVKVRFQVVSGAQFGGLERVSLLLTSGAYATISLERSPSWEGGKRLAITVEGFATARLAEEAGQRVSQALTVVAIEKQIGIEINYRAREPGVVFERNRGQVFGGHGELTTGPSAEEIVSALVAAYDLPILDNKARLALEIFCASRVITSERVRFVMAVSSLEPLAQQTKYGAGVTAFIAAALPMLETVQGESRGAIDSLKGRLRDLKRESVSQAIKRMCADWFPNDLAASEAIWRAYGIRSEVLHDGEPSDPDTDFATEIAAIEPIISRLFRELVSRASQA